MILALSSSCDWCSVALFESSGAFVRGFSDHAPRQASRACLQMIEQLGVSLAEISRYGVDTGPGSFAGTRVAVMIGKTLAWQYGRQIAGLNSFDLIDRFAPVLVPNKRGESFLRVPGEEVRLVKSADPIPSRTVGYGERIPEPKFPNAARATFEDLEWTDALLFTMSYLVEPSISTPKKPYAAQDLHE